jgi:hypothetical protein
MTRAILVTAVAGVLGISVVSQTHATGKFESQTIDVATELQGAPVFASDGPEVGKVLAVSVDADGQPQVLQMTIGTDLGFGPRTIELSGGGFTLLRGAVVLVFTAAALKRLPEVSQRAPEK